MASDPANIERTRGGRPAQPPLPLPGRDPMIEPEPDTGRGTGGLRAWGGMNWRYVLAKSGRVFLRCVAGYFAAVLLLVHLYVLVNPPASTLMITQAFQGVPMRQTWVALADVSPNLIKAVVISEDAQFCSHWGVDWHEMRIALADGGRGASTIPMQTVKNLFLWPGRNYLRKVAELPLAHITTLTWSKRRMLEIYLNVAEWGPGVYGIEEAAQRWFKTSAKKLSPQQSALLAAMLPAPLLRKADAPGRTMSNHASRVRRQFDGSEAYLGCVLPEE